MSPADVLRAMLVAAQAMPAEPQQEQFQIEFLGGNGQGQNTYRVRHTPCPADQEYVFYSFQSRLNDKITLWSLESEFSPDEARRIAEAVAAQLGWLL